MRGLCKVDGAYGKLGVAEEKMTDFLVWAIVVVVSVFGGLVTGWIIVSVLKEKDETK
jgi:hypothetical protein